jgi:hypothetical protein
MKTDPQPRIVEAERMTDGILITFEDGKCAVFSSPLLYATLPQARHLEVSEEPDWDQMKRPAD